MGTGGILNIRLDEQFRDNLVSLVLEMEVSFFCLIVTHVPIPETCTKGASDNINSIVSW